MLFATSADVLNMSLAIGFIVLTVFLSILIFYAILILRDTSKITDDLEELVARVKSAIIEPLKAFDFLIEKLKPYIEMALERRFKGKKKKP